MTGYRFLGLLIDLVFFTLIGLLCVVLNLVTLGFLIRLAGQS